ncbi:multiple epidermal growth factor-like domains protein 6 [Ylistrum balloti]|uniref:multiple epidermal growth factor-like domains protein 6 n=1 Tax=Ylistrum balloti TaxID=509963 RepID=UPI002905E947|nr:multiple epidermal growth factor-like domains protein 6 [Ylistrum balloti]
MASRCLTVLFLMTVWLTYGVESHSWSLQSPDSTCSERCLTGCNPESGVCDDCLRGFYGDLCQFDCDENCAWCNRSNGECIECSRGWYGEFCDLACEEKCLACENNGGACVKCKAARWGPECTKDCPDNCISCDMNTGECRSCNEGYYGINCTETCGHCWQRHCGRISGECVYECEEGWFGARCKDRCLENCSICNDKDTCSICHPGLAGIKCDIKCPSVCSKCMYDPTSEQVSCTECTSGLKLPAKDCTCRDDMCLEFATMGDKSACNKCKNGTVEYLGTCCPCSHCKGGNENCHSMQGCTKGCEPGFYSTVSGCDLPCGDEHCTLCQLTRGNAKICTLCEDGWYPNEEGCYSCSENCAGDGNPCNNETGVCLNGCNEGWHNHHCDSKCNETCTICDNDQGICKTCDLGYWGIQCENQCPDNCKLCNITSGACLICEKGYVGANCTDACKNCEEERCQLNTGICDIGCKQGWFGDFCSTRCPPGCLSCDSTESCLECSPGKAGLLCQYDCPNKCKSCFYDDFTEEIHCESCGDAYEIEEKSCECSNSKCTEYATNVNTVRCKSCEKGWFPYMYSCCPCSKCEQGQATCERVGKCSDGCGTTPRSVAMSGCSTKCSISHCTWCEFNSTGSETCLMCSEGWYPSASGCQSCSDHCVGTERKCDNITGNCLRGCLQGWHGKRCLTRCNDHCAQCNETSGVCRICNSGFWGDECENTCEQGCKQCTSKMEECKSDQIYCNRTSGHCLNGCNPGLYGGTCDTHCKRCKLDKCSQENGQCLSGCIKGWTGLHCDVRVSSGFEPMMGPVVGGAVGMGLVIIIIIVSFVCFLRKQKFSASLKIRRHHNHHHHHHHHNAQHHQHHQHHQKTSKG